MAIFSIKVGQWLGSLLQVFVLGLFSHGKTDLPPRCHAVLELPTALRRRVDVQVAPLQLALPLHARTTAACISLPSITIRCELHLSRCMILDFRFANHTTNSPPSVVQSRHLLCWPSCSTRGNARSHSHSMPRGVRACSDPSPDGFRSSLCADRAKDR
jgi:hypothetical protein